MFLVQTAHSNLWPSLILFWPVFNNMKVFLFPPFSLLCFSFVHFDGMFPFSTVSTYFLHVLSQCFCSLVKCKSWTTVILVSPAVGWVLLLSLSFVQAAPRGRTSWMSPEYVHVCLTVTVSALLQQMCVFQLISECTWRTTHGCCLWHPLMPIISASKTTLTGVQKNHVLV